jgi:ribosome-binding protein aMBF1 (putative translation factor)
METKITKCDICGKIIKNNLQKYIIPILFTTEQTEGRNHKPYIDFKQLDVCDECLLNSTNITGCGCMGYNKYKFINLKKEKQNENI